eukprot:s1266_g8.t1
MCGHLGEANFGGSGSNAVQGVGDAWQTLARTIGDQLGQVQRLGHRLGAGVQELSDNFEKGAPRSPRRLKSQPTSPKPRSGSGGWLDSPVSKQSEEVPTSTLVETEELPGTVVVEAQWKADTPPQFSTQHQDEALQRSSTANDNALTFAEMQKQYGVKGKAMQTFIEEQDSGICCLRRWSIAIVSHRRFEMVCASLVILCAAMIGVEADYEIRSAGSGQHPVFRGFDIAFNTWFAVELALRWTSEGLRPFFSCENPAVKWNIMDCCLVVSSALEEIAALLAAASFLEVSTLRMLRMMRLVRVARVIRMLRFFSDLRVMVNGTLLGEYMFATYVFFTIFCCLNIVTGIFVDNAKALKGADEDAMYLEACPNRASRVCIAWPQDGADVQHQGSDPFPQARHQFGRHQRRRTLGPGSSLKRLCGVQKSFAPQVTGFEEDILDADQSGCIDEEEFAKGLKFFQGPAQSIHVYRLMREGSKLHDKVERLTEVCHEILEQQKLQMPE